MDYDYSSIKAQIARRWRISRVIGNDEQELVDTGIILGDATTYRPERNVLPNGATIRVRVTATDGDGLSSELTWTFTTNFAVRMSRHAFHRFNTWRACARVGVDRGIN